jgi:sugar O-acyltransferase (sialic acid O-acetyltransferase NeuD family)
MYLNVIGLYGAGGFGREVMSLLASNVHRVLQNYNPTNSLLCFIDDDPNLNNTQRGKVLSVEQFLDLKSQNKFFNVTIANPDIRKRVVSNFTHSNVKPISLVFNKYLDLFDSIIEDGVIIMPQVIISTSVKIGKFSHINFNSYIAHDCVIEEFVTVSPSVTCCGYVIIKQRAFIGAGATIKQGAPENPRVIGIGSRLGLGSNLLTDIPDFKTFAGNPAIAIK